MNPSDTWWMEQATCKRLFINPILFYPVQSGRPLLEITTFAKKVCAICPVNSECLSYAVDNNIVDGIWGGQTRAERKRIRRLRILLDRPEPIEGESAYG